MRRGLITEAEVDSALTRVLDARLRLGLLDPSGQGPWAGVPPEIVDSGEHRALAREAARKSIVLLKNEGDLLPLRDVRRLAVIGPDADDVELLLGNYNGWPAAPVTPLAGLRTAAAERGIEVAYARGSDVAPGVPTVVSVPPGALRGLTARYWANHDFAGEPFAVRAEPTIDHQWWREAPLDGMPADSFSVRWTGTLVPPATGRYALGARLNGGARVFLDDSLVVEFTDRHVVATPTAWVDLRAGEARRLTVEYRDRRIDAQVQLVWAPPAPGLLDEAVDAAARADVAVLFLGLSPRLEGEEMPVEVPGFAGGDRVAIGLPAPQEELLRAVVATGTPVVLALMSGSALAVPWAAERVPAILEAWYPGQAAGDALADVLLRGTSPAGRLPVTFYRSVDQLPPFPDYAMEGRTYRYFRGEPLFPFGHGLSYARFRYRDLQVPERVGAGEDVEVSVTVENVERRRIGRGRAGVRHRPGRLGAGPGALARGLHPHHAGARRAAPGLARDPRRIALADRCRRAAGSGTGHVRGLGGRQAAGAARARGRGDDRGRRRPLRGDPWTLAGPRAQPRDLHRLAVIPAGEQHLQLFEIEPVRLAALNDGGHDAGRLEVPAQAPDHAPMGVAQPSVDFQLAREWSGAVREGLPKRASRRPEVGGPSGSPGGGPPPATRACGPPIALLNVHRLR